MMHIRHTPICINFIHDDNGNVMFKSPVREYGVKTELFKIYKEIFKQQNTPVLPEFLTVDIRNDSI